MANYIITYTSDKMEALDDDFFIVKIVAHNQKDVDIIINNVERYFDGVVVTLEQEEPKTKKRRNINSDRRSDKH